MSYVCTAILFFASLVTSTSALAAKFEKAQIVENIPIVDVGGSHEITFVKPDGGAFEGFVPGDLIVLRKNSIVPHDIHVYALSYFTHTGDRIKIIVDSRYRFNMDESMIPSIFQPLSLQLCKSSVLDDSYEIKVLHANIPLNFFSGPISMVGFGKAVTRQVGFLRYIEENFADLQQGSPVSQSLITLVHSVSVKDQNSIFLKEEFMRIQRALRGVFVYQTYLTGSPEGKPRLQKKSADGLSALDRFFTSFSQEIIERNITKSWGFLVTAPDATYKQESKIEDEYEAIITERRRIDSDHTPDQVFRSKWKVTDLSPGWF